MQTTNKTYAEKLKDPRWQKLRLKIFERDYWQCIRCDCDTKMLHAHHLVYDENCDPWEYNDNKLVTLCEDCHELAHGENAEQILKEICPTMYMYNFAEEINCFNKYFINVLIHKPCTDLDENYCRCLRAYFSYSNLAFTTKLNIIKRIKEYYVLHQLEAYNYISNYSEDAKYLIFAHKYIDFDYSIQCRSIEDIIGETIKNILAEPELYISYGYKPTEEEYEKIFNAILFGFVQELIFKNTINESNNKYIEIEDPIKVVNTNKVSDSIYNDNYLYDINKWIECFDNIE